MLKMYIKEKNISMYELSKKTGISYSTINDLVNGKVELDNCRYGMVRKIAEALDMTIAELDLLCSVKKYVSCDKYRIKGEIKVTNKKYHVIFYDGTQLVDKEIYPVNEVNTRFVEGAALWDIEDYFLEKEMKKAYEIYINAKK